MPDTGELFWEDLLISIESNRVIPVVGIELVTIKDGATTLPAPLFLARKLAAKLGVNATDLTGEDAMNMVVSRFVAGGGRRVDVFKRLANLWKELAAPVPTALRQLAEIKYFNLFVTTTTDTLLEQALNEARFAGRRHTRCLVFSNNQVDDLPPDLDDPHRPLVYHLMGRLSALPDSALTEDDMLEFFTALGRKRPKRLFEQLRQKDLLLVGNRFPDWLARFFMRMAKGRRLSAERESTEFVADEMAQHEKPLVLYLQRFSKPTRMYEGESAAKFVAELSERYKKRLASFGPAIEPEPQDVMPDGAVFISYARGDHEAANRVREACEAGGVEVWFDKQELEPGDAWEHTIRRYIRSASLFVPLLSATTEARAEGFFRAEWDMAADRSRQIASDVPFIIPLFIDQAATPGSPRVHEAFKGKHAVRFPDGKLDEAFVSRLRDLQREYRRQQRGVK
jgi:hypothetical protein